MTDKTKDPLQLLALEARNFKALSGAAAIRAKGVGSA